MKTKSFKISSFYTIPAGLVAGLVLGYFLFSSPKSTTSDGQTEPSAGAMWSCAMHPQVQLPEAGPCPICGMDLIPLSEMPPSTASGDLQLSDQARALAAIQTTEVKKGTAEKEIRLFGKVTYDETRLKTISARFPARIEKLFVNATGISVKEGDHLASVYSKDLLAAQTDLITALKFSNRQDATQGPREQLRQWGFSAEHINEIEQKLEAQEFLDIDAPIGGAVVGKSIQEGDHVNLGDNFFTIADLTHVWITFDAYESDLPWIHYGQEITINAEANPGKKIIGKVSLIYPEIDPMSRTAKIRVSIPNPDQLLKPGQFVRGILRAHLNESGGVVVPDLSGKWVSTMHPEIVKDQPGSCDVCGMELVPAADMGLGPKTGRGEPLLVPSSAILQTGKRAVVYVETLDAYGPSYDGREVELGVRAGDQFVILSGLQEGERVVSQGAFKIDSALQIQAKPSMMSGTGREARDTGRGISLTAERAVELMPGYLALQKALAEDDLEGSKAALNTIIEITGHTGAIPELIHSMLAADDLEGIRRPKFDELSSAMIQAVRSDTHAFEGDLYLMHCPMVYGQTGADWIQSTEQLLNPYFGSQMLTCGNVQSNLTSHEGHNHGAQEGNR
jgi:Cu(I)/Ag(I) efflux system membrane fusion protein